MPGRLHNKSIIVTGAASGIGRETAIAIAREGGKVACSDVNETGTDMTVDMIKEFKGQAFCHRADVSKAEEVSVLVDETVQRFGRLDGAFNNAGIEGVQCPLADCPPETWDRAIGVNLVGTFNCMKYEIRAMLRTKGGSIVNNSSILGYVGFPNASAYVAAKHGVLGLTKTGALDYATQGIRVNAVCPGFIETPMLERGGITTNPELRQMVVNLHPMKRMGTANEIAESVIWLLSDTSSFVTGVAIPVDGGYLSQ